MEPHQLWVPIVFLVLSAGTISTALWIYLLDRRHHRETCLRLMESGDQANSDWLVSALHGRGRRDEVRAQGLSLAGTSAGFVGAAVVFAFSNAPDAMVYAAGGLAAIFAGTAVGKLAAAQCLPALRD